MIDIEDLLHEDARQWNARQRGWPDLDAAVGTIAIKAARRRIRPSKALTVAATVIVLLGLAGTALALRIGQNRSSDRPVQAPSSIGVNGKTIPYAGLVPWSDALTDKTNPRMLTIKADGDAARGNICGPPVERVVLVQTSTSVTVIVAGYAPASSRNVVCAAVGHPPQVLRIALDAPLAGRTLVDAYDNQAEPVDHGTIYGSLRVVGGAIPPTTAVPGQIDVYDSADHSGPVIATGTADDLGLFNIELSAGTYYLTGTTASAQGITCQSDVPATVRAGQTFRITVACRVK